MKLQILKIGFGILTPIIANNLTNGIFETLDGNALKTIFIVLRVALKRLSP